MLVDQWQIVADQLMTYQLKADQLMADKLKALSIYCRLSEGRYHLMREQ